jgi:anaerobic ribonucleoside-triphosphate reductase
MKKEYEDFPAWCPDCNDYFDGFEGICPICGWPDRSEKRRKTVIDNVGELRNVLKPFVNRNIISLSWHKI